MNKNVELKFSIALIIGTLLAISPQVLAGDPNLKSALSACKNVTAQQRQMAKAAGYDVSALCSAANQISSKTVDTSRPIVVTPRAATAKPTDRALEKFIAQSNDAPNLTEGKKSKTVNQRLQQFGYDLFAGSPTTFAPATEIPVMSDYLIGPGDSIKIQLFGNTNESYILTVSRDGSIQFPELGPITLAGLTFVEMKALLTERVAKQMIGVQASITLGELRSIRIFILGDVTRPGSYTVSSLSSMTNALFVSGGVRKIGSLRNIQLKRQGKIITSLDLYDLLLRGDTSNDVRLLPGDVIFIPPIGKTAGVSGDVKRPAIYELKNERSVSDLITLAGGYLPSAYPKASRLERINKAGARTLIDVDLTHPSAAKIGLVNGDVLQVYSVLEKMENIVLLEGHVYRPGGFSFKPGMRVSDLLGNIDDMLPVPDLDYALLIRELMPTREIEIISVDLRQIFDDPNSHFNLALKARDRILVFGTTQPRTPQLEGIIKKLQSQEKTNQPAKVVSINGSVRFSGTYPLTKNMSFIDLIGAGGGLRGQTFETVPDYDYSLLIREIEPTRKIEVHHINLQQILTQTTDGQNMVLQPRDKVLIFAAVTSRVVLLKPIIAKLKIQERKGEPAKVVTTTGVIRFPGTYPLTENMTVRNLVYAGGGLKESTYVSAAEITRKDYSNPEEASIMHFSIPLKLAIESMDPSAYPLMAGDSLGLMMIPKFQEKLTVTLRGEVKFPGTYEFVLGETLSNIVKRAGGLTELAHIEATFFARSDLRAREAKQIAEFKQRLKSDLAAAQLEDANSGKKTDINTLTSLMNIIESSQATGRLVINLQGILSGAVDDVQLRDGDSLSVPTFRQEIIIIGEVQNPTSHLYNPTNDHRDYIEKSGGTTEKADESRIYIVKADGSVYLPEKSGWFHDQVVLSPGDTIIVPLEVDRLNNITFWTSISQIIYQLALGAAAVNSL